MSRTILGLSLSPTWLRGSTWRAPDSDAEGVYGSDMYVRAARLAERAHLDFVFKPDAGFVDPGTLGAGIGFSAPDPIVLMSVIAQHTEHIGLVPTISSTFAHPYPTARQLQSLDVISGGRVGWNVVTSLGGAQNYPDVEPPTDPYANAADFITMIERLRATFPADALLVDRDRGIFADTSRLDLAEPIGQYASTGPLPVPARDSGPLPLLHAGGSPHSRALAARFADAVFTVAETVDDGVAQRCALRAAAEQHGRADAVRLLPGLALYLAETVHEAAALAASSTGAATRVRHWTVIGTPSDAVGEIIDRVDAGAADGVIALPAGSWRSLELFTDQVVPQLAAAGYARTAYHTSTLRDHLEEA